MSRKDSRSLINGAYSLKYQILEQERLKRLQIEHKDCSKSLKERAQQLSKQTQQRRRALEEKKQAMAKAEEERRKKALDERRRQQKEATERFRTALSRQVKPKSPITFEMLYLPNKALTRHTAPLATHSNPPHGTTFASNKNIDSGRVAVGEEVEIPPLFSPFDNKQNGAPNLDHVLESMRGSKVLPDCGTPSMESLLLSPEPANQAKIPEVAPLEQTDGISDEVCSDASSTTSLLQDSLDSADLDANRPTVMTNGTTTAQDPEEITSSAMMNESTLPCSSVKLDCRSEQLSICIDDNTQKTVERVVSESKKGILKKFSGDKVMNDDNSSGTMKRVRFSDSTIDHCTSANSIRGEKDSLATPKMRISLNGPSIRHQVISSTVTKLGSNGVRNGIIIHIPQSLYQDTITVQQPAGESNHFLKSDKHHNKDNLWSQIGTFVQHQRHEDSSTATIAGIRKRNCQPVKLWKRHQTHTPRVVHPVNQVDSCSISTEEKRLMESIEMINNKLRTLPISPNQEQPVFVQSQISNQSRRPKQPILKQRTYHSNNNY